MSTLILVALSMGVGYAASHVGIPPITMAAIVSTLTLCGEYVRRLALRYLRRRWNG